MYKPETILRLKQQRDPIEGADGEKTEFPYNRVIVIGASPVNHAGIQDEWVGSNADGIVLQPLTSFGSNLDEPLGRVQELYEVESLPEEYDIDAQPKVRVVEQGDAGPSPEQVFATEAEKEGKDGGRRVKPPKRLPSPLAPDVGPTPEEIAKKERVKKEALRRAGKTESPLDESPADPAEEA